ncbi:isopenicillin N synthase family dioxygenase [Segnochrobactrum spirostomi]|uniref:2-oxoglutarate-dependent ethylene/succinate-forming enzyme n=1 Tax=Segnochrobactrum spirostomi TaxID=2608987 RepID=A0A6A7Y0A1_9HYPH|nr:isopenicillin N synthase family oxygenase [Segnochrobactrum spirostomi]MQT12016.1 isopenicillin N synthase family oxygenase [Segnochrobactrum spirostomi]
MSRATNLAERTDEAAALGLPVLDFSRFDAGPAERAAFLEDLRAAARDYGFFYLVGHGIPAALEADVVAASRRFFALPQADKLAIEMVNSPHFRGYTRAGFELTRGRRDWREQFDVNTERAAREIGPDTPPWARLQGPNQWPAALPDLKPVVLAWQKAATDVAIRLLKAFAIALDQPENVFEPIYAGSPNQHIKLIRYPGRDATDDDQGVGAHKDSGFLTLLLQDVEPGLEVETDTGWVGAPPLKGSFIVNIGEILEMASNGYLRATVHRVVTPPAGHDRLSVAFFLGADHDATVPLLELPPARAAEAKGPARDPDNPLFYEVGRNYLKGRLRSHPDVARRHYADLVSTPDDAVASSGY